MYQSDKELLTLNGKEEGFYAHFGPSSGKLGTKEVLANMSNKKH